MKIIKQINIQYYRSLKNEKIKNLNEANIFSGKNDVGKSNVLKALDLFFNKKETNFLEDFNKERLKEVRRESVKGKQYIKIEITFLNPGNYKTLPNEFKVTKTWDRTGNVSGVLKDNFEYLMREGKFNPKSIDISRRTLTGFLNKVRYTYVPAIRDDNFFYYLLSILQDSLFSKTQKKNTGDFSKTLNNFNEQIGNITRELKKDFQNASGVESNLSFPTEIADLFQRLVIDTKSGEHDIPLKLRGDGIRLRYIPTILNYIAKNSKFYEIWGFDEPENSCEYSLARKLAENFSTNYLSNAQIYVSTHSFSFISLDSDKVSKYRVFKKNEDQNSEIVEITEANEKNIQEDIGLLYINENLSKLYNELEEKLEVADKAKDELQNTQKPFLIFEGKTDNSIFSLAYKQIKNKKFQDDFCLNEHFESENGTSIGSGAGYISEFLRNHIGKIPTENLIVGIFDYDTEGFNKIKGLKKHFKKEKFNGFENCKIYRHKKYLNIYAISLVTPDFRDEFTSHENAQHCFLSTELLFRDYEIPSSNRSYPTPHEKTIYNFSGNKTRFKDKILEKVNDNEAIDFSGFKPTLDLIDEIHKKYNK